MCMFILDGNWILCLFECVLEKEVWNLFCKCAFKNFMLNLKCCGILWPLTQAIKFLENSKTAILFFLLQPNYKLFSSDSYCKMILVILYCFSKNLVNFWAQEAIVFQIWTWTDISPFPLRLGPHVSLHPPLSLRLLAHPVGSWGGGTPSPATDWPPWPVAEAPRRSLASPSSI